MTGPAAPGGTRTLVTVFDRLHEGHPYRPALAEALRAALATLGGDWRVTLNAVGSLLVQVDVGGPSHRRYSAAIPVALGPAPADAAAIVRTGCSRLLETQ